MHFKFPFFISREVKLLQANLKKLQVESDKRDAELYANMFDRITEESDAVSKVHPRSFCVSYTLLYENIGAINSIFFPSQSCSI